LKVIGIKHSDDLKMTRFLGE